MRSIVFGCEFEPVIGQLAQHHLRMFGMDLTANDGAMSMLICAAWVWISLRMLVSTSFTADY